MRYVWDLLYHRYIWVGYVDQQLLLGSSRVGTQRDYRGHLWGLH